jgi:hypothetical protein
MERLQVIKKHVRGSTSVSVVLSAVFVVPLLAGIYLATTTNRRSAHAAEVSRDLASMYSQGVDFSQPLNQNIALRLLNPADGKAVLILTRMRAVSHSDCGPTPDAQCTNYGYPVVVQRIVIGDPNLHGSSLGTPLSIDHTTGKVLNWATDASARVTDSSVSVKPGETAYAAETFIAGPEEHTDVYARTIF